MTVTQDRNERRRQKDILRSLYPDYDPKHHDAFVIRYQNEQDKSTLHSYMQNRGIV